MDFSVRNEGSFSMLVPYTQQANDWIAENIGEHQSLCGAVVVEHRYINAIIYGIIDDGLEFA